MYSSSYIALWWTMNGIKSINKVFNFFANKEYLIIYYIKSSKLSIIQSPKELSWVILLTILRGQGFVCNFVDFFIPVGGNRLAHSLAKRAVLATDTEVWLEELSPDLINVFQFDLP